MGLYNFKIQFVPYVVEGSKTHTIRQVRKHQDAPGSTMHLYYGCRALSPAVLLGRFPCAAVEPISIDVRGRYIEIAGNRLNTDERDRLAWSDGFRPKGSTLDAPGAAFALMSQFWQGSELRLDGTLNRWTYDAAAVGEWEPIRARLGTGCLTFAQWLAMRKAEFGE